jgi:hypothetical protein
MKFNQKILKSNQITNKVVKLLARSIIIISLFILNKAQSQSQSQSTIKDTIGFKKDFEALLRKHGIKSEIYSINVTSNNQSGGQTAFVINNNYINKEEADSTNFTYKIYYRDKKRFLEIMPKKGVWHAPFVATSYETLDEEIRISGCESMIMNKTGQITTNSKSYNVKVKQCNSPCSKVPIRICLSTYVPDEIIIIGDWQDSNKNYIYKDGIIRWIPLTRE